LSCVCCICACTLQCWRQWQESVEENKAARVALSFFSNITLRKAFNQWLAWAQERQEYGTKLQLAVQVLLLATCRCAVAHALLDPAANAKRSSTMAWMPHMQLGSLLLKTHFDVAHAHSAKLSDTCTMHARAMQMVWTLLRHLTPHGTKSHGTQKAAVNTVQGNQTQSSYASVFTSMPT